MLMPFAAHAYRLAAHRYAVKRTGAIETTRSFMRAFRPVYFFHYFALFKYLRAAARDLNRPASGVWYGSGQWAMRRAIPVTRTTYQPFKIRL